MTRVRARVRELTPRARCHTDPPRRHRGPQSGAPRLGAAPFTPGTRRITSLSLNQYVNTTQGRLRGLLLKRAGSRLDCWPTSGVGCRVPSSRPSVSSACAVQFRLCKKKRGWRMPRPEDHLVSRVREIPHARFERGSYPRRLAAGRSANLPMMHNLRVPRLSSRGAAPRCRRSPSPDPRFGDRVDHAGPRAARCSSSGAPAASRRSTPRARSASRSTGTTSGVTRAAASTRRTIASVTTSI